MSSNPGQGTGAKTGVAVTTGDLDRGDDGVENDSVVGVLGSAAFG